MVVPVADMEPVLKSYSPASSETLLLDLVYPNRIVQGMYRDIGSVWVARSAETGKYYLSVGQDDWRYHFQILKTGEVAGTNHRIGLRYWRPELVSQSYLDLQYQLDKNSNERLWAEHQQAIAQPGGQDALAKERELLADPARLVVGTALDELSLPKAGSGSDGDAAERLNEFPQKDGRRQGNVRHIAETVKEVA